MKVKAAAAPYNANQCNLVTRIVKSCNEWKIRCKACHSVRAITPNIANDVNQFPNIEATWLYESMPEFKSGENIPATKSTTNTDGRTIPTTIPPAPNNNQ